ncbi:MAG: TetR/AcrR family transcriptional regulator [Bacteroidota bacterium]
MSISRRDREKEVRREEMIAAAEKLCSIKGINSFTMDDVARLSEFSKATIYKYFDSKEEILSEINKKAIRKLEQIITENIKPEMNGYEKVKAFGSAYFEFALKYEQYHEFVSIYEADKYKITGEDSLNNLYVLDSMMIKTIEEGISDGTLRGDIKPEVLSKSIWAMTTGLLQMLRLRGDSIRESYGIELSDFYREFYSTIKLGICSK